MDRGLIGQIATPAAGNIVPAGRDWCADNGVYGGTYPGDAAYLEWLADRAHLAALCRFAVAPDVVCDAAATLARSLPMLDRIRAAGYRVAYAAQNGATPNTVPWDRFDVLFIGGDTPWKLGSDARRLAYAAHDRGQWVHMGRVNSRQRVEYAAAIGCDSADGTYLAFGPDRNLPTLLGWLADLSRRGAAWQPPLTDAAFVGEVK